MSEMANTIKGEEGSKVTIEVLRGEQILTLGRRIGKRWNSSRNLKEPTIVKQVVNANTFADKTRRSTIRKYEKQGYYMVKDSERTGISEMGFRYYEAKFRRHKGRECG